MPRRPLPPDEVHVYPQLPPPLQVQGVPGQGVQVHHQAVPAGQAAGTAEQQQVQPSLLINYGGHPENKYEQIMTIFLKG